MSSVAAPKRHRRRKFQSKRSFFGPTSIVPSTWPSNMQANLPELFALLTTQPEADADERRCDAAGYATEPPVFLRFSKGELLTTPERTTDKCKARSSSDSAKPSDRKECEASASDAVDKATSFVGEDEATVNEKREPKALTESNVVVRMARERLEGGPAEEVDQLEGLLSTFPAHMIIEGALTTFLDSQPELRVAHEDLYSFVYYKDPEDEESSCSSLVQDGATAGPRLASSNDTGRQYAVLGDGGPRRTRASSSSSSTYECAADGDAGGSWQKGPSPLRHQSRAEQAEAMPRHQTQGWDTVRWLAELTSSPDTPVAEIAELASRRKTTQESYGPEAQQLRVKIEKLLKTPAATARSTAELSNSCTAMNEPTTTDEGRPCSTARGRGS